MEGAMTSSVQECSRMENAENPDKKMITGKVATSDAKTVSNEEKDTEVANGEMDSGTTDTNNTMSIKTKKKRRQKKKASNDISSVPESTQGMLTVEKGSSRTETDDSKMVSKGEKDTKVANGEMDSRTTDTNYTMSIESKKKKRRQKKKVSNDILSVPESTQDMLTVEKGSSRTETNDSKMVSKGEKDTKVANGEMDSCTTDTNHTMSIERKKKKRRQKKKTSNNILSVPESTPDLLTVEKGSSRTETDDSKTVSKGEKDTKVANGEMDSGTTDTNHTMSIERKKKKRRQKKKASNDILSVRESTQDMLTVEKGSSRTETDDSKTVLKGEKDTKVANGEMGSDTTATNSGATELTKSPRKRPKKKIKFNAENPDSKCVLPYSNIISESPLQNNPDNSLGTFTSVDQKHEVSTPAAGDANTESKREDHMETSSNKITGNVATSDAKTVSNGEDTEVADGEMDSRTTATDSTVSKKRNKRKRKNKKASNDISGVHESTQDMETVKNGSSRNETDDSKMVAKGEEDTKVVNGEMSSGTIATNNGAAKLTESQRKRLKKKIKCNAENSDSKCVFPHSNIISASSLQNNTDNSLGTTASVDQKHEVSTPAAGDANTESKREEHMETSSNKMITGKVATSDAKTVSNGEDTAVANGEMDSRTTATDNAVSKKKNKRKGKNKKASNDISSVHEITQDMDTVEKCSSRTEIDDLKMVSKGDKDTKVANGEMDSGTTETNNSVSKKRKRKTKKASSDILTGHESTQDMETVDKGSSRTETDDSKMVSKGEMETKVANGEIGSDTTATNNTVSKKKKKQKENNKNQASNDILSVHESTRDMSSVKNASSRTETNDSKIVSKGEEQTKVTNGKMGCKTTNLMNGTIKSEKIHRSTNKRPTLGEILNPQYLKELELAEAKRASSKQMSKKIETIKIQPTNLNTHENTEVKASNDITHAVIPGKKLLIFDINGLLADIVSPRPKDIIADKYIPKRAIFKRPFLDDFLRFCFERFNVGIWSSRTKKILDPVVDFLLGNLKKNLLFIWDASLCTGTGRKTIEDKHKPMVFKDLRKIWHKNGPGNSWVKGTYHESNTLLVDDSPYKALLNPKNTAIFPLSYSYENRNDDSLGPNGALRTYLEGLADSDDVKTYVEQHPFGQLAIDETHRHWSFYSKSLKGRK